MGKPCTSTWQKQLIGAAGNTEHRSSGHNIAFPAQMKRLYVVNVEEGQDERIDRSCIF